MIPIKRYKKCFTTKDGKVVEYISFNDFNGIIKDFRKELDRYIDKKLELR